MSDQAEVDASELEALGESIADVLTAECDRRKVHAFIDGKHALDDVLWEQATELGWLAVGLPEAHGGLALGVRGLAVLHRELGTYLAPGPFISTLSAAQTLAECGDAALQEKYLPRVAEGKLKIAVPATPLASGKATLTFSGGKVSGSAEGLLGAADAGAALLPVLDGGKEAWAVVEVDGKSAKLAAHKAWDATRTLCSLECQSAPATLLKGAVKSTLGMHMALAVAFDGVGAARAIHEQTLDYMKNRVQFDKVIASFQGLKHRMALQEIEVEMARHSAQQALDAVALNETAREAWASLSKVTVSEAFCFVAADCVQLHGGVGHTWEFDCHIFLKRSRLNEALVAPNNTQLDQTAEAFAAATKAGRSFLELPL